MILNLNKCELATSCIDYRCPVIHLESPQVFTKTIDIICGLEDRQRDRIITLSRSAWLLSPFMLTISRADTLSNKNPSQRSTADFWQTNWWWNNLVWVPEGETGPTFCTGFSKFGKTLYRGNRHMQQADFTCHSAKATKWNWRINRILVMFSNDEEGT